MMTDRYERLREVFKILGCRGILPHNSSKLIRWTTHRAEEPLEAARPLEAGQFQRWNDRLWRIEKLLFADDRKFSEPLVRLTRFDARDHINHRKNTR